MSHTMPDDILAPLRAAHEVGIWEGEGPAPRQVLLDGTAAAEGLLSMLVDEIDEALLGSAPALRVISQMSVGLDNLDITACRRRGIRIGHTPDVLTETVADTAFALIGSVVRRLPEGAAIVRESRWGVWDPWAMLGGDLFGSTLGIIGMGRIGQAIARRATGFEMKVLFVSRGDREVPGTTRVALDELLQRSDVVVVSAPLTEETRHLIGARELAAMGPDAFLVNVARGGLVDTDALVEALRSGSIGGAALDVTEPEPLPRGHPLLSMANCLVVPHIGSASVRARRAMATLAVENLIAGLAGAPMPAEHLPGPTEPR